MNLVSYDEKRRKYVVIFPGILTVYGHNLYFKAAFSVGCLCQKVCS